MPWRTGRRKFSAQADLLTKKLCVLQEQSAQESSHTLGDRQARRFADEGVCVLQERSTQESLRTLGDRQAR